MYLLMLYIFLIHDKYTKLHYVMFLWIFNFYVWIQQPKGPYTATIATAVINYIVLYIVLVSSSACSVVLQQE